MQYFTLKDVTNSDVLICFTTGKGFLPWAIQKITGSSVSHVFMAYYDQRFGPMAVEAMAQGIFCVPIRIAMKKRTMVEVWKSHQSLNGAILQAEKHISHGYDFVGIVRFLFRLLLTRITGNKIKHFHDDAKRDFCSEVTVDCLAKSGAPGFHGLDGSAFSPGDIKDLLRTLNGEYLCVYQK